ncbi:MAG: YwaF family protein [Clostridia bacterium]|nr:YwaF family protein [Clostridia bacterium]
MNFWDSLKEFLRWGGVYARTPEGAYSWQHLLFVSCATVIMIGLAILFGLIYRKKDYKDKNKVLIWSAILIDGIELINLTILCLRVGDPFTWVYHLPLFLCSIQMITIPLAAFTKGRLKETAIDFVFVFGLMGAMAGTWGAANIYSVSPVISFDVLVSTLTHDIAGFASLYVAIAGMTKMEWKNMPFSLIILTSFCVVAYLINVFWAKPTICS